jgi:hypothetical protein
MHHERELPTLKRVEGVGDGELDAPRPPMGCI